MNNYFDEKLVEQYFPEAGELMLPAMLIWKFPKGREEELEMVCNSGEYFASIKKDGACYQFVKTDNYSYLFGRTVSKSNGLLTEKIHNVPHIQQALSTLPPKTILLIEIYYPHKTAKEVVSIMGCLPQKAIERQKDNPIHAYVHDIIYYDGVDLRQTGALDRYRILEVIWNKHGLSSFDFLELAQPIYDGILNQAISVLEKGEEGLVLRKKDGLYYPGKRPAHVTIKIKEHDSIDLVCTGFCDATKEYTGKELETWPYWELEAYTSDGIIKEEACIKTDICQYGVEGWIPITKPYFLGWKTAIKIGCYDNNGKLIDLGTVSSGLTDSDKEDMINHPEAWINQVVSLDCMSIDKESMTLRHPVFKCRRNDKNAKECIISDIFK